MYHSSLVRRFVLLGLFLLLPGATFAGQPSFNCAKASSKAEKAICRNAALAASDATIALEYRKLQSALDPRAAAVLAEDERWFVGTRDAIAESPKDMAPPDLGIVLKDRIKFLRTVNPHPADPFAGSWHNVAGGLDIAVTEDGRLKVVGNAANPVNGNWVCQFEGSGKVSGDALEVRDSGDDGDSGKGQGTGLRLTRDGAALKVQFLPVPGSTDNTPPYCGMNGSLDGGYFSVPAGYQ